MPSCDADALPEVTLTLADQMKDPALKIIASALSGDKRVAKATRASLAENYELDDGGLFKLTLRNGSSGRAFVVPRHARAAILARHHYALADGVGHTGGDRMHELIGRHYYWDELDRECHAFAQACETCGGTRSQPTFDVPTRSAPTPSRPFEVIHIDHKASLRQYPCSCPQ